MTEERRAKAAQARLLEAEQRERAQLEESFALLDTGSYAQVYRELKATISPPKDLRGETSPDTVTLKDVG